MKIVISIILIACIYITAINSQSISISQDKVIANDEMLKYGVDAENNPLIKDKLFTGYVTYKDEKKNIDRKFFYYVNKYSGSKTTAPTIFFFCGGPGVANEVALSYLIGPFKFPQVEGKAEQNEVSWNQMANIVYIDQPAGTGFSEKIDDQIQNDYNNAQIVSQVMASILRENKFKTKVYLAGESYAGTYIPNIALAIEDYNSLQVDSEKKINLDGFAIANPCTDGSFECLSTNGHAVNDINIQFIYSKNLISEADYKIYQSTCLPKNNVITNFNADCITVITKLSESIGSQFFNVQQLEKLCAPGWINYQIQCIEFSQGKDFFDNMNVRKALHIQTTKPLIINKMPSEFKFQKTNGSLWAYPKLLQNQYKILIISGMQDTAVPTIGTRKWIKKLLENGSLDIFSLRKPLVCAENHTLGWLEEFTQTSSAGSIQKKFSYIELLNSGHQPFFWTPEEGFELMFKWINNIEF